MSWLIYGYKEKENQKVCYIGQTSNEEYRRYKHEKYDPYHDNIPEYNYPLSRGIRKYGLEYYEYFVIEKDIQDDVIAIEREAFWIDFYNTYNQGFNQTPGGKAPKYIKFDREVIELAKQMIKDKINFNDIAEKTGISVPHLSQINTGKRHHDDKEVYPLNSMTQGRLLSNQDIEEIIDFLRNTKLSQKAIGEKFNIAQTCISQINLGKTYKNNNLDYPIRK